MRTTPDTDFEEDPRYKVAMRELGIALAYWAVFTIVVSGSAWLIGGNVPAEELTFVLGFPAWFFWSCLFSTVVLSLVPMILVRFLFTDMPLSPDGEAADGRQGSTDMRASEGR